MWDQRFDPTGLPESLESKGRQVFPVVWASKVLIARLTGMPDMVQPFAGVPAFAFAGVDQAEGHLVGPVHVTEVIGMHVGSADGQQIRAQAHIQAP